VKLPPDELGKINESGSKPKFLQIADRIRELIDCGKLTLGDRLPSVNEIIAHFTVSRDTAVKAYQELKDLGIIESTPNKACFVSNVLIRESQKRILLLIDSLTVYKEKMYYGLIDNLGPGYYVDIVTHGDNFDILKVMYEKYKSMRDCAACLVIPTAAQSRDYEYFKYVNPGNLLFLDRKLASLPHPASWQNFGDGFHSALLREKAALGKYRKVVFLTKFFTNPIIEDMKEGITRFAGDVGMDFVHQHTMFTDRDIEGKIQPERGNLYVILDDHLLAATIDACASANMRVGPDVGIAIINDGPLYARLPVPISVLTADFYRMGALAAQFVMTGDAPTAPVPTTLVIRESLMQ